MQPTLINISSIALDDNYCRSLARHASYAAVGFLLQSEDKPNNYPHYTENIKINKNCFVVGKLANLWLETPFRHEV